MKKQTRPTSHKELAKLSSLTFNQLEIEETPSEQKFSNTPKSDTLAQRIPKLPESKFFPGASLMKRAPRNLSNPTQPLSTNTSASKICNVSAVNMNNLSLQHKASKETSVNFSQFSQIVEQNDSMVKWTDLSLPSTPIVVMGKFVYKLTSYEMAEILKYPSIWCIGVEANKVQSNGLSSDNYGFDDENGDYKVAAHDHIAYRYELFELLGRGSFGQVFRVFDYKHKMFCALKIIKNKKRFNQQALVEIDILRHLRKRDENNAHNIVHIQSSFSFRSHICICFEMLSMNLYHCLKLNRFQGLSLSLVKRFAVQILQALSVLQQAKIIHCDLKPENILLKQSNKSAIKVIDFGSSCFTDKKIYSYIQSRFYRAPEIILGMPYTTAIDMWSFGCILVELYTGFPLFPGENEAQQLLCIMEYLGVPSNEYLQKATRRTIFFTADNRAKVVADSKGRIRKPGGKSIQELLKNADESFVRLVECCFIWEPNYRIMPQQALLSEWITENSGRKAEAKEPVPKTCKNTSKKFLLFD